MRGYVLPFRNRIFFPTNIPTIGIIYESAACMAWPAWRAKPQVKYTRTRLSSIAFPLTPAPRLCKIVSPTVTLAIYRTILRKAARVTRVKLF